jgi:two-component system, OmpR family, response regulator VicR
MSKPKLLVVEDDPNLGDILQEYLTMKGYETTLCRDGDEGWSKFKKDKYSLAILDIMMPKKDGFTLGKEIKKVQEDLADHLSDCQKPQRRHHRGLENRRG